MNWKWQAEQAWRAAGNGRITTRRHEWLTAMILAKKSRLKADNISDDNATKLRAAWAIYTKIGRAHV